MDNNSKTPGSKKSLIWTIFEKLFYSKEAKISYFDVVVIAWLYSNRKNLCEFFGDLLSIFE